MKILILCLFLLPLVCFADTVCLDKSGKLIEYQSGNSVEVLTKNALNSGYKLEDIEVKIVSLEEAKNILEEKIYKPAKEKQKEKEIINKQKEERIKTKLNLTDKELQELKDILK